MAERTVPFPGITVNGVSQIGSAVKGSYDGYWAGANQRRVKDYFDTHNGEISNYAAGIGYVSGAVGNWAGNIIKSRSLYGVPNATIMLRTSAFNVEVSTSALRMTGTAFKTLGIGGVSITGYQYFNGQITGMEALVDATFGAIGFMGPIGAGVSIVFRR